MNRNFNQWHMAGVCAALLTLIASAGSADELIIPALTGEPGKTVTVPIVLDKVDNLAGIKISLKYDTGLLQYKKAEKAKSTSSFLHVVNDKKPGLLIIVMASAVGIKGKDLTIMTLDFEVKPSVKEKTAAKLDVSELQLMSDKLKELKYKIKSHPIDINVQSAPSGKAPETKPDNASAAPKPDTQSGAAVDKP